MLIVGITLITFTDTLGIKDYISAFDQKYKKIAKLNMKLPSEILAFKLLKHANLNKDEHMIVFTGMGYSKKDTLYEQAKKSLYKFKGIKSVVKVQLINHLNQIQHI